MLAVIGDVAVRLTPDDPQSAHAKVLSIYAMMIGAMQLSRALGDRQLADEILEQGAIRDTRPGEQTDANAPGARQPGDETGTDPIMGGGELASSIQRPSASAPAQRNHESTTIIWSWLGRSPSSRAPPG